MVNLNLYEAAGFTEATYWKVFFLFFFFFLPHERGLLGAATRLLTGRCVGGLGH